MGVHVHNKPSVEMVDLLATGQSDYWSRNIAAALQAYTNHHLRKYMPQWMSLDAEVKAARKTLEKFDPQPTIALHRIDQIVNDQYHLSTKRFYASKPSKILGSKLGRTTGLISAGIARRMLSLFPQQYAGAHIFHKMTAYCTLEATGPDTIGIGLNGFDSLVPTYLQFDHPKFVPVNLMALYADRMFVQGFRFAPKGKIHWCQAIVPFIRPLTPDPERVYLQPDTAGFEYSINNLRNYEDRVQTGQFVRRPK